MTNPLTRATAVVRPSTGLIPSVVGGRGSDPLTRWLQIGGLVLVVALLVAAPYLGLSRYYIGLGSTVFCAALLAASVNFLIGQVGLVPLGHAGIAAVAAYGVAISDRAGLDLGAQLGIALLATLVVSLVYGVVSMRTSGIYFIMVTLAIGMLIYGLAYSMSSITFSDTGINVRRPEAISEYWVYYYFALAIFIVGTVILWVIAKSPFGASLRGIRDSESRMRSLGYNVEAYKVGAFVASGLVAGMAGVLTLWSTRLVSSETASILNSVLPIIMVVLGGVGTILGPLVGAIAVVYLSFVVPSFFERWETLLGAVFIVVIMFARTGIVGSLAKLYNWIRRKRAASRGTGSPDVSAVAPIDNHRTIA